MGKKKEGKPFCTRCGRRMKRIVRSGAEPALLFHCPKCGATLPRHGEDWRRRDILFILLNEVHLLRRMVEKTTKNSDTAALEDKPCPTTKP